MSRSAETNAAVNDASLISFETELRRHCSDVGWPDFRFEFSQSWNLTRDLGPPSSSSTSTGYVVRRHCFRCPVIRSDLNGRKIRNQICSERQMLFKIVVAVSYLNRSNYFYIRRDNLKSMYCCLRSCSYIQLCFRIIYWKRLLGMLFCNE